MNIPHIRKHQKYEDNRGVSARVFGVNELALLQSGESYALIVSNLKPGTIRGMHMHLDSASPKLVTVTTGQIFDLCVDLRDDSPRRGQVYLGFLRASDGETLVIPPGFLHGYQALEPQTTLLYALDESVSSESVNNFNPLSPSLVGHWPSLPGTISDADLSAPELVTPETIGVPFLVLEK